MLIDPGCKIPGVYDNETFSQWLLKDGRVKYRNVVVRESKLGGIGLFYTSTNTNSDTSVEKVDRELLRLKLKYDYNELLGDLSQLKPENSAIVKNVLSTVRPSTETAILQCYFVAFKICIDLAGASAKEDEKLAEFIPYVDILCNTHVDELVMEEGENGTSRFLSSVAARQSSQLKRYTDLNSELGKLLKKEDSAIIKLQAFKQIEAAVRSRVLEIPYEDRASSAEAIIESEGKEDDYYTNVTLVPLLDFVNHSSELEKNAYFDVDKETGDILLKLKEGVQISEGTEITICYSPTQNIQAMVKTYGFIPTLAEKGAVQLFELILPPTFLNPYLQRFNNDENTDFATILKWLQIFPLVQLVLINGKVYINYFSNLLPLALVKGFEYDPSWQTEIFGENEKYNEITDSEERKGIVDIIKLQENEYDTVIGIDQKAVKLDGEYPTVENILEIKHMENEEDFANLQTECTKMIYEYCKAEILQRTSDFLKETKLGDSSSTLLRSYTQKEIEVLSQLVKEYEAGDDLILPEEIAEEDWELDRTGPKFYF
ncbi:hypothetical protein CLIB1423_25S00100 [[Candida] railenensis]|uniref:SET domain-containing protein n=1 Tax=[Candida] railenensis TaxID=45579 RepID=A0A9P0QTG7_9ASCO|nr:hypothetical protein CLIB1423_25S00100 [[Candida] railenensis]